MTPEQIAEIMKALDQTSTRPHKSLALKWQDVSQFPEVFPSAIEILSDIMGITPEEFVEAVKNGDVLLNKSDHQSKSALSSKSRHNL
jgi:alkylhydroperoxidase/carboxymuconolactone decarboxylase family protein YurZ